MKIFLLKGENDENIYELPKKRKRKFDSYA